MAQKGVHNLTYGMYLLTTRENGQDFGCLVNTAIQVSSNPMRLAVCVVKRNFTHDVLLRTKCFNLSALTEDTPFELFQNFGMRSSAKVDKFTDFPGLARSGNGFIYPAEFANMYLSAEICEQIDLGDHTLFIGRIEDDVLLNCKPSCSYDYYLRCILPIRNR